MFSNKGYPTEYWIDGRSCLLGNNDIQRRFTTVVCRLRKFFYKNAKGDIFKKLCN